MSSTIEESYEALRKYVNQEIVTDENNPGNAGYVTRVVCVVEVLGEDDQPYMLTIAPNDGKPWVTLGMLQSAASRIGR